MSRTRDFNYAALPFEEIGRLYKQGWGWKAIADHYGAPDHKTLARRAAAHLPDLELRDHTQAQRARRAREGTRSRRTAGISR